MTPEELTQFTELAKKYEAGKDKEAVLKVVKEHAHEVFQDINDGGRSAANKDNEKKLGEKDTEITRIKLELTDAQTKLQEAEKKTPDLTQLRTKYEADIQKLQADHTKALQEKDQLLLDREIDQARDTLVDALEKAGVDREYASAVLVQRPEVKGRLKHRPDDKKVGVLKKGETELFLVPTESKTAVELLADELAQNVHVKWKTSSVKGGTNTGGSGGTGGGGAGGGGSSADRFEKIRQEEANRSKQSEAARSRPTGIERLRGITK